MVDTVVTGADIVKTALSHLNQGEVPPGSNTGPFVIGCQRCTFLAGTKWPWCAAFICKACKQNDRPLDYPSAGALDLYNHYKAKGFAVATQHVKPGMVVAYNIGTGHTGIVVGVDLAASTVDSVDGNWADKVTRHTLPLWQVAGFWKIPDVAYEDHPKPKPPPPPLKTKLPPFVVSTSANGKRKILFTGQKKGLVGWLTSHTVSRVAPNGIQISRGKKA